MSLAASPATLVSLILSDVVKDPLDIIASGPTIPDPSTFAQAATVLGRHGPQDSWPRAVHEHLQAGLLDPGRETPGPGHPCFRSTHNILVGSNAACLAGCRTRAEALGYNVHVLSAELQGEAGKVGPQLAGLAGSILNGEGLVRPPACVLAGGETTVTVKGDGVGGRNQELALAAAFTLANCPDCALLSIGTDGTDGPTDAAGAAAFEDTLSRAALATLDPARCLENNDSYTFFTALGDGIRTGPTGTNVMDVQILLVGLPIADRPISGRNSEPAS